ncbi:hypothetical protein ACU4GI_01595 [Cupriavidus basilensis]|jgi:hypothetical protein
MSECGDLPAQAPGRTAQRLILRRGIANHQRRPQGPAAAERTQSLQRDAGIGASLHRLSPTPSGNHNTR